MVYRIGSRWTFPRTVMIGVALVGLVWSSSAFAQAPPPPGDPGTAPPPAKGQPSTTPPPADGQPSTAPPPGDTAPVAPPPPRGPLRARETQLQLGIGGEFFVPLGFGGGKIVGAGPAFKLSSQWLRWWGPFMLGGGTSIHYSFMIENKEPKDKIQQMTVNGDLIVGGGVFQKFAIYAHVLLGAGVAFAYDGETRTKWVLPWIRAVAGVGGWAHITKKLSLGLLVDIGWPGTVEVLATASFHFSKRH